MSQKSGFGEPVPISGSNVRHASYDAAIRVIAVTFRRTGETYHYYNVPENVWEHWQATRDGAFFEAHIRGKYAYRKA
jgi:hypothetical protein